MWHFSMKVNRAARISQGSEQVINTDRQKAANEPIAAHPVLTLPGQKTFALRLVNITIAPITTVAIRPFNRAQTSCP